jgi:hypothetical protein
MAPGDRENRSDFPEALKMQTRSYAVAQKKPMDVASWPTIAGIPSFRMASWMFFSSKMLVDIILHCSPRQLQRILNSFVRTGTAKKIGKGAYELT